MSPRAACRLETLGFNQVYDYAAGKVDWLAHSLETEGTGADELTAGRLVRDDAVAVSLDDDLAAVRSQIETSNYGFALVIAGGGTLLGRVRRSALEEQANGTVEAVMEAGPSTVRPHLGAEELLDRLIKRQLMCAVVTTPEGRLVGVVRRSDLEKLRTKAA